jgi:2-oxoisovalerate dehydrogenase E2 component (dihydrolipoyl transacylase)
VSLTTVGAATTSAGSANLPSDTFMLPDLGEGLTEAEVIEWHVAPGDEVSVDQIVVTVETAKATVDLPCPYAGPVLTLHGEPGAVLEVGKPLLTIGAEQKSTGQQNPGAQHRPDSAEGSSSGNVLVGYGTSEARRSGRRRVIPGGRPAATGSTGSVEPVPPTTAPAAAALPAAGQIAAAQITAAQVSVASTSSPKVISPVVRKLARDNKINLAGLAPTGPGHVIRRADVEAALQAGSTSGGPASPSPCDEVTTAGGPVRADRAGDLRIPLRGVRKTIADKLTRSRREIPEASVWVDVDATGLLEAKNEIKAVDAAAGIGLLALFARISVAGLAKFPELNARVDVEAQEIVQLHDINLSFAAQSPRGLVVPVVHGAGEMTTAELAAALRELTGLARDGRLSPAQMTGGTFTLNNYGVFGTDGATPIINYPEAAMLGVGRIIDRPWAYQGQVALRKVTQLGLTFDHRVCDGGSAGGFLRFVADCVEKPALLLAAL